MQTTTSPTDVAELAALAAACEEGRRRFQAAARAAEDIPSRAIYTHQSRHCESMRMELEARLQALGGYRAAPLLFSGESDPTPRSRHVRCLNWCAAAARRYELALRRRSIDDEDRFLLSRHRRWLEETVRHIEALEADASLIAA